MIDFSQVIDILLGNTPVEQVSDSRGNVLWSSAPVVLPNYFYVEDTSGAANTLSITKSNANAPTINVFCSTDKTNWTNMGSTSTTAITATVPANGKLYLKATTNKWGNNDSTFNTIIASGNHNVGGNIMSLLYGDNFEGQTTFQSGSTYIFFKLFYYNANLVSAENLLMSATTLVNDCYKAMFQYCTKLTTPPALPATTATQNCYQGMFQGCSSLTTAPTLPATSLTGSGCYGDMFNGCASLTTAPALPATTLYAWCYASMFHGCTALTTAPVLPATTLAQNCYYSMFNGCSRLNSVTTYANNISASYCLTNWLSGVAATGDFNNMACTTYPSGASGIPQGWTEHHTTASTINVTITNTNNYSGATYQIDSGTVEPINVTGTTSFTVPATATNLTVNRNGRGVTDILGVCGITSDSELTTVIPVGKMSDNVSIDLVSLM